MGDEFKTENDALLTAVDDEKASNSEPRRNTKKSIIAKIKSLCEEHGLALTESDTTLQRSSKTQLNRLLAQKTEALIEKKMKDSLNQETASKSGEMKNMMAVAYGTVSTPLTGSWIVGPTCYSLGQGTSWTVSWTGSKTPGRRRKLLKF